MTDVDQEAPVQPGALPDLRPEEEKLKDFHQREVVSAMEPPKWREKPASEWRRFPIFNQNGSGSCVAQTLAKLYGVMYWLENKDYVHFSATHIYQRRNNKPQSGMAGVDAFAIAAKGVTLEELVPSQNMTDQQMDTVEIPQYKQDVGKVFAIPNYLQINTRDIDAIASTIEKTGKAVMVWFYFLAKEWTARPNVQDQNLDLNGVYTCRHSVAAVDYMLVGGKKCLLIDDSWGTQYGQAGQRIIDEDFYNARNWFAAYPMQFQFQNKIEQEIPNQDKQSFNFAIDMEFGMTNPEVSKLQQALKYLGLFPANTTGTNYFGAITKTAVQKFQVKYNIAAPKDPGYGRVGPKTRAKLNELF